ncbi:zinc finger protein 862-like [Siphateles boraxobius]|uniref:zinc finger protein 862-like n=1 Tax=Siphateles boraxobius TaxID=180520 RepID=UPI004062A10F
MGSCVPCALPTADIGQRQTEMLASYFGDSDVQDLITHFEPVLLRAGVKVEEVLDQWTVLKSKLDQDPSVLKNISWREVNQQLGQDCPDILHVADLILCIPASTADCEWGYSAMKLVKSDFRASLKNQTLSDLLTVQLSSVSITDFDPVPAIKLWHVGSLWSQGPAFMEPRDQQRKDESDDKSCEDISSSDFHLFSEAHALLDPE